MTASDLLPYRAHESRWRWRNCSVAVLAPAVAQSSLTSVGGPLLTRVLAGALIAGFKPQGMARAMYAVAAAQAAMTVYALVGGYSDVVVHVGCFVLPWLLSAGLFNKAALEAGR